MNIYRLKNNNRVVLTTIEHYQYQKSACVLLSVSLPSLRITIQYFALIISLLFFLNSFATHEFISKQNVASVIPFSTLYRHILYEFFWRYFHCTFLFEIYVC